MAEHLPTHYQRLGVHPRASAATIREAYLRLARLLHPDQAAAATPAEARLAERRMREVNEAWAVLKDPSRRTDYDRHLAERGLLDTGPPPPRRPTRAATFDAPADDLDDDRPVDDGVHLPFLLGRLPWIVLAAVAAAIFVVTAYAKTPTEPTTTMYEPPNPCVEPAPPGSC